MKNTSQILPDHLTRSASAQGDQNQIDQPELLRRLDEVDCFVERTKTIIHLVSEKMSILSEAPRITDIDRERLIYSGISNLLRDAGDSLGDSWQAVQYVLKPKKRETTL